MRITFYHESAAFSSQLNESHSLLVLGKRIGAGSFGQVHQARYGDQSCAAKSFFLSQSGLDKKTIQKEVDVLQKLRYRHIIQFYRTYEDGDCIYLLMELAEKGSLAHAINKGEIAHDDWTTKKRLAHEIARGLAYIHQEKVLHRDLKSANVLLTKNMEVRLADFGLAQIRSAVNASSSVGNQSPRRPVGTLRWVAPELLYVTKPEYSTKSDVYSLGMVMWEIAADCTRPFKDQPNEKPFKHYVKSGGRELLPDDTPEDYRTLVELCWGQDPHQRPNASDVILLVAEPTNTNSSMTDSYQGLDITESSGARPYKSRENDENPSAVPDKHDNRVGRLPESDDDIVSYFCTEAKRGNADAQLFLGWMFDHGRGAEKSRQDSLWWYLQAANGGSVVAQLRLAKMYESGHGLTAHDDTKAAKWYRKAAEGGNTTAGLALAKMYTDGRGVQEDTVQAARWYRMAAEQEQPEAQTILGQWYSLGRGVNQSDVQAARWLTKAAGHGNARAQRELGRMYLVGRGVQVREVDETTLYSRIADRLSINRGRQMIQSDVEAVKWFTKAAVQGDTDAQFSLAWMHLKGRGVEQSDVEAIKWYTRTAEQGNEFAQKLLGWMYERGDGLEQNDDKAVKWYTMAAEQGDANAQCKLAWMHKEGRGTGQSDAEAVK
ncbi:hypothetical protein BGZ73_008125, partial [Actinomortierella ambigua]